MNESKKSTAKQVVCPKCGYRMPIFFVDGASCKGVVVRCKGRGCSEVFEVKIEEGKQIK